VEAFSTSKIRREQLFQLISKATILDVETDSQPFSHTTDKYEFRANPLFFE
jgi:hypothetical protein